MTIATLEQKSVAELHEIARALHVPTAERRRRDLIYDILEAQAAATADASDDAPAPTPTTERPRRSARERQPIAAHWPAYMHSFDPRAVVLEGLVHKVGVLEILPDGYGFLRSAEYSYLPSPDDIYVSPSQIKRFALRVGDTVDGQLRPPKEGERFFALLRVNAINGHPPDGVAERTGYDYLTPAYPDRPLALETTPDAVATRLIDLVAPIGKGQRGLIVAPPHAGRTVLLQTLAQALTANHPDATLLVLLVDERPEEVTDFERAAPGAEVIASTFDEAPERQVHIAELALEKAKRLVEAGRDVVILLDSITRLARAYNAAADEPGAARGVAGELDPAAMRGPKRLFGAARAVEEGGSLTVIATVLVETGSALDALIAEEVRGTGNMELTLSHHLAARQQFPAIDVHRSRTRREEMLIPPDRLARIVRLRQSVAEVEPAAALAALTDRIAATDSNDALLAAIDG